MTERRSFPESRFLRACRGEPVDRVPVWFMRQAGRSLPEYLKLRSEHSTLDLIREPDLAAEVTLQPLHRYDVDAAILFGDIVVPLRAMGVDLRIEEGVGPVIEQPVRTRADLDRLRELDAEDLGFVWETISILSSELEVPLIGFAGAPFTLACYLVEGGPSKDYARTKALMYSEPDVWKDLMERLADATRIYLSRQIAAGASAVQLFDSWVGALSRSDFERFARPAVEGILTELEQDGVPRIYFGVNTSELLPSFPDAGADVVGVDHRITLEEARHRVGPDVTLQGNLDPAVCLASWEVVEERALEVLRQGGGKRHVFNLGHGVLPQTHPGTLARLVDLVHGWKMDG